MSFSLTSSDIKIDNSGILSAVCLDWDKNPRNSSLDLNGCIGNVDGFFKWGGHSFSHTAQSLEMIGNTLMGELKSYKKDYWVQASLNLDERIKNDNGVLKYV